MTNPQSSVQTSTPPSRPTGDVEEILRRAEPLLAQEGGAGQSAFVARAPGRLDVMGGIAEYTGALVLGLPLAEGASAVVQPRGDRDVVLYGWEQPGAAHARRIVLEPDLFAPEAAADMQAGIVRRLAGASLDWARPIGGALYALRASGKIDAIDPGLTIVVDSAMPAIVDISWSSAVAVAVLLAACRAWNLKLDSTECAHLAMRTQNDVLDLPCGIASSLCALFGQPGALTQIDCRTNTVRSALPLPAGVGVIGVDCGMKLPQADEKYRRTRVSGFMGRRFIEHIARHDAQLKWNGCLAQVAVDDYVRKLRDRIPIKMKGADFLERFNDTADPLTTVDAETVYRVRSRTEHHIYEAARTHKFAERITYAAQTRDMEALVQAGALMLASHWSYGQRCGLGSVQTDQLVKLLRGRGVDAGIYGAKVSAHGAGGVVVVLMRDDDTARDALAGALREYERDTCLSTTVFRGGSFGATHFGVWEC